MNYFFRLIEHTAKQVNFINKNCKSELEISTASYQVAELIAKV